MTWQHTIFVYPTVFAALVAAALGAYGYTYLVRNGRSAVLVTFIAAAVSLALWSGFASVKLLSTDFGVKLLAYKLLYLGASPIGSFALMFALTYTDREEWLRPGVVAGLLAVPALYLVLLFTNPANLAIEGTRMVNVNGLAVLRVDVGPAHFVLQLLYNLLLTLLALGLVATEAVRLGRAYVPQAALLGFGIGTPVLFVVATYLQVPPFSADGINLVPTSTAFTAMALGVALFRYRLLDLSPIAYTTALKESPDGVLVLDTNRRVVHANDRGEQVFARSGGTLGDQFDVGFPAVELSASGTEDVRIDAEAPDATGGTDGRDGSEEFLSLRAQRLHRHGHHVGWVVVLRDVTDLHRQKQAIEAQNERLKLMNQIIRHDIRNDMSVVLGNAHLLESAVSGDEESRRLDTIVRHGEHAVELTETIRGLMRTMLEDSLELEPVSLAPILTDEVACSWDTDAHSTVTIEGEIPDVRVVADDALGTVFGNLLTNAVRHADTDAPTVEVSVTEDDESVVVSVADDGPGIPVDKREEIFGRGEKGLESSGTGIGLYLVQSLVDGYGGRVWVEDNDPRGSVFRVRLRKAAAT